MRRPMLEPVKFQAEPKQEPQQLQHCIRECRELPYMQHCWLRNLTSLH